MTDPKVLAALEAAREALDSKVEKLYKRIEDKERQGGFKPEYQERRKREVEELEPHLETLNHFINDYNLGKVK